MTSSRVTLVLVSFLFQFSAQAGQLNNIDILNRQLQTKNAGWMAKDNWLNHLQPSELQQMMGLRETPSAEVEFMAPQLTRTSLPNALDWRNKEGKNWVSPILNQGNCGSCVAFAAVGVMETQLNIAAALPGFNVRLSPQNLFSCGGGYCSFGWVPQSAIQQLMKNGIPDESCMPYTSGATGKDVSCKASCKDTSQRSVKISNYTSPTRSLTSVEQVKQALQKGPVMTTLTVYEDFMVYASGVYQHSSGKALGGHAVSIVGYDDATQSFIIRNSWGEDWGEQGFAHVAYADSSGVGRSTWGFEIPALGGAVSIQSPRDYSYLSGDVEITAMSSFASTDSLGFSIYSGENRSVAGSQCRLNGETQTCSIRLEAGQLQDGRYEVEATALDSKGEKISVSSRQFFYVVNQRPKLALSYVGLGVDLSKDLNGRVVFDITTSSSSAPLSSLEFHFRAANGQSKTSVANLVVPRMTMGWRTNLVANGSYEIWLTGHLKTNSLDEVIETEHRQVTVRN